MLTCIYHPIDPMRVVEEEVAEHLIATKVWFDCPAKAAQYRANIEHEIKQESGAINKSPKAKLKGKQHER